jgi:hypothetical protein
VSQQNGRQDPAEAACRKDKSQRDAVTIEDFPNEQRDQRSERREGDEIPRAAPIGSLSR